MGQPKELYKEEGREWKESLSSLIRAFSTRPKLLSTVAPFVFCAVRQVHPKNDLFFRNKKVMIAIYHKSFNTRTFSGGVDKRSHLWNLYGKPYDGPDKSTTNIPARQGDLSCECSFVNKRLLAFDGIINCIGKPRLKLPIKTPEIYQITFFSSKIPNEKATKIFL